MHTLTMTPRATTTNGPRAPVRTRLALLATLLAAGPALAAERTPLEQTLASQGYDLVGETRGVKVYKHRNAKTIRVAAEGVIAAPPAEVREVVTDYRAQEGKVDRVSESRVLRQGPGWLAVYQRLNLPIISDRDYTLMVRWGREPAYQWVTFDAASWMGPPPRDGIVRVSEHSGSWQLKPVEGGRATFVRFQSRIDFAGSVPRWMVRGGAAKELPNLFANLCRLTDARHRSRPCN
jgi:hypothetical protein